MPLRHQLSDFTKRVGVVLARKQSKAIRRESLAVTTLLIVMCIVPHVIEHVTKNILLRAVREPDIG